MSQRGYNSFLLMGGMGELLNRIDGVRAGFVDSIGCNDTER